MSNITQELPGETNLELMLKEVIHKDVSSTDERKNLRKQKKHEK